jgi:OPA family glycerol-3-phosphate transporter-like MFS transporter
MGSIFTFLRPAAQIPRLPDEKIKRIYPRLRWQIMESTFIGYAIFYLVRNNLPVVSKEIGQSLGYSKGQIGDLLAITAISYGVGKFFMGAWSDRSNPRFFMPLGLLFTAMCNFAFATASSYPIHLALWGLNGLAQSMGWAPCGRSLGHWYSIGERGTKFAFWNVAQNLPGILAIVCAIYLVIRLRDTPQSVGLPPIEEYRNDYPPAVIADSEKELATRDLLVNYILKNRYVWLFAGANFFTYIARYSMLDWGPTYLKDVRHATLSQGGASTAALEFSAIFSSIAVGWISDKLGGRRGMISMLCMIPVFLAYIGILLCPDGMLWLDFVLFGVIGFFVYPTILLLVVSALDFTSKKAVGTAAGFIGMFGYVGRVIEGKGIGVLAERYGWTTSLHAVLAATFMAIVLLSLSWKMSPHDPKVVQSRLGKSPQRGEAAQNTKRKAETATPV